MKLHHVARSHFQMQRAVAILSILAAAGRSIAIPFELVNFLR